MTAAFEPDRRHRTRSLSGAAPTELFPPAPAPTLTQTKEEKDPQRHLRRQALRQEELRLEQEWDRLAEETYSNKRKFATEEHRERTVRELVARGRLPPLAPGSLPAIGPGPVIVQRSGQDRHDGAERRREALDRRGTRPLLPSEEQRGVRRSSLGHRSSSGQWVYENEPPPSSPPRLLHRVV